VERTRERLSQRAANAPTISQPEVEILRRQARQYVPHTVERLARNFGFNYTSLRISSAHTRWGSCSGKNGISLSLFLMLLPEHLREFIILHELCHTRHHNHSAAFHALLNTLVGGKEKALNRELKAYHIPRVE
jgi:predicted metal-dependent hydrolase